MIQLLFALLLGEVGMVLLLLIKSPLRRLVVLGLDRIKRGKGPIMVRTVLGTLVVVFGSSLYGVVKIRKRSEENGVLNPTDQVLLSRHLLEASLLGYSLFLSMIIDRMHHCLRKVRRMKKSVESLTKQNKALEEGKTGGLKEIKAKDEKITMLSEKISQLELDCEAKAAEFRTAEASAQALKRQSEGFLLEYDRLLEDNQNLRSHLKSIDFKLSRSDSKKMT